MHALSKVSLVESQDIEELHFGCQSFVEIQFIFGKAKKWRIQCYGWPGQPATGPN